jgi:hypothetical protein
LSHASLPFIVVLTRQRGRKGREGREEGREEEREGQKEGKERGEGRTRAGRKEGKKGRGKPFHGQTFWLF